MWSSTTARPICNCVLESKRRAGLVAEVRRCHAHVAAVRRDAIHKITTRLAKTHGTIVVEDLNVAGIRLSASPEMGFDNPIS